MLPTNQTDPGFLKFLRDLDGMVSREEGVEIRLVMDNYATNKSPDVRRRFNRRPEYIAHFTPTGTSWLNDDGSTAYRSLQ